MSLSTLRVAVRPAMCLRSLKPVVMQKQRIMSTAIQEMKSFWTKNQQLKRPSSPWTIYHFHLPMTTSLTHRVTGVVMGVTLYIVALGLYIAPGNFQSYVELIKSYNIPTPILFACKTIAAFPLVYHYFNGIRHLSWDYGVGFLLSTQYKSGATIMMGSAVLALCLASLAYIGKDKAKN